MDQSGAGAASSALTASSTSPRRPTRRAPASTQRLAVERYPNSPRSRSFPAPRRSADTHVSAMKISRDTGASTNWRVSPPPGSRADGGGSSKNADSCTERHVPSAVRTQRRLTVDHPFSSCSRKTAAHKRNSRSRRAGSSPSICAHHRSRPSAQACSRWSRDISVRSPTDAISLRPPAPRTLRTSTDPFRSMAGLRAGCCSNAAARGAGGTITSRGAANDKSSRPSDQTGTTPALSRRSCNLDSQRCSARTASSPPDACEGNASAVRAWPTVPGSENVRATQTRKLASTSATRSAMSRCQGLSSISLNPVREMFKSQSALMWSPNGSAISVGSVA